MLKHNITASTPYPEICEMVAKELESACAKFPPFHSAHEGYAVLKEEVDELFDAIRANDFAHAREEAIQVAAMALRFIIDLKGCDKRGLRV